MNINITVTGVEEITEKLNKIIDKGVISQALLKGGKIIEAAAKGYAPVADGVLRASIQAVVNGMECVVGTNVSYAIYQEFGTGIYALNGGRQTPWCYQDPKTGKFIFTHGNKPTQFMTKAFEENQQAVIDAVAEALQAALGG